jgi:hypothetical protein
MTTSCVLDASVQMRQRQRGRRHLEAGAVPRPLELPPGRVPRVARLMALAIKLDGLVRQRVVPDYAALARLGHVSRARITQIMNLLLLAPDIQEQLLFLPDTLRGRIRFTCGSFSRLHSCPTGTSSARAGAGC